MSTSDKTKPLKPNNQGTVQIVIVGSDGRQFKVEKRIPNSLSLVVFCASKLVKDALLFPLDTVKTRLQSSEGFSKSGGFRSVYRGLWPASLGCVPATALGLWLTSFRKKVSESHSDVLPTITTGSVTTELLVTLIHTPFEVIKRRRQTGTVPSTQLVRHAFRNEGIFGIFRGFWSSCALQCTGAALTISLTQTFKFFSVEYFDRPLSQIEIAACFMLGAGITEAVTTPLDVAKTRIMLYKIPEDSISTSKRVPSLVSILRTIYEEQGIRGLYAGALPRTALLPLGNILFGTIHGFAIVPMLFLYTGFEKDE